MHEDSMGLRCRWGVLRGQPRVDTGLDSIIGAVVGDGLAVR